MLRRRSSKSHDSRRIHKRQEHADGTTCERFYSQGSIDHTDTDDRRWRNLTSYRDRILIPSHGRPVARSGTRDTRCGRDQYRVPREPCCRSVSYRDRGNGRVIARAGRRGEVIVVAKTSLTPSGETLPESVPSARPVVVRPPPPRLMRSARNDNDDYDNTNKATAVGRCASAPPSPAIRTASTRRDFTPLHAREAVLSSAERRYSPRNSVFRGSSRRAKVKNRTCAIVVRFVLSSL